MIIVDLPCQNCKNYLGIVNGWDIGCKAYPNGIEIDIMKVDVTILPECANGYKYEPKDE